MPPRPPEGDAVLMDGAEHEEGGGRGGTGGGGSGSGSTLSSPSSTSTIVGCDGNAAAQHPDTDDSFGGIEARMSTLSVGEAGGIPGHGSGHGHGNGTFRFQFLTGMKDDLKARYPHYKDDWIYTPQSYKTLASASTFSFVVQLIPALIFADLMERNTRGNLSTSEVLLSSAVVGVLYAVLSGQPLVLLGITGPLAILLGTAYNLTVQFDAPYFPFFFWTCAWAGLLHLAAAMTGVVHLVWRVTPFTTQVFELFTAVTFLYSSLKDLVKPLHLFQNGTSTDDNNNRAAGYASLVVGMVTFHVAWTLHFAETWLYFPRQVRGTLAAYNTLIAVLVGTALSYLPGTREPAPGLLLPRVNVTAPWDWQPTADRPWIVNPLQDMGAAGVVGAMIPGLMIFLLFIIDHNVSSILTQSPKFRLKKPPAYHWDFFVLGLTFVPCALLGLPPGSGLLPQAPLHARSLCTREIQIDASGVKREVVTHVEEQRWTALAQSCLMFVALAAFRVISWIPLGCLYGLFFYLGCGVLHGNEVWDRIAFAFVAAKKRPDIPVIRNVRWSTVVVWTAIQTACAVAIFAVAEFLPVGYIYPVLLALLVPLRSFVLERTFRQDDLTYLDPCENPEGGGGYREEQREIHRAERRASLDGEEDLLFPNRAEFRRQVSQGSHGKKDAAAAAAASIKVLVDEASDHANGVHRC